MIPRTAIITTAAVFVTALPFSAVARPHDAASAAAAAIARDIQVEEQPAARREPIAAALIGHIRSAEETIEDSILVKESLPEALLQTREDNEDDDDDEAKGKGTTTGGYHGGGGGGYSSSNNHNAATTAGGRPAAGFALIVGVAAVVMASMMS
ncbi:hypothetical protein Micbo1qcDRAFT_205649 [Microdochium bolleyi]|uniref:Uncharacterized protein n=1 Tax=Microdochium bolleyi TaxID=196109 RepID=A0A136IYN5_9PEZI|nr:hypothetical protein Micbo1qcDRAFT_205649 [Microdochium bolleyi]